MVAHEHIYGVSFKDYTTLNATLTLTHYFTSSRWQLSSSPCSLESNARSVSKWWLAGRGAVTRGLRGWSLAAAYAPPITGGRTQTPDLLITFTTSPRKVEHRQTEI